MTENQTPPPAAPASDAATVSLPAPAGAGAKSSVLRNAEFMLFSVSQAVSLFGDKLDYMAMLALIAFYSQDWRWGGTKALSYFSVVGALPTVLFGPLAGVLVDRWDRRKVMIVCDTCRTVLAAAIPIVAILTHSLWLVFLAAFMVFGFGLFFNTARLAVIPNLVGEQGLLGANSVMNLIARIATFLGMFLGGLIVDWSGWERIGMTPRWSAGFYIDALTYALSVVAMVVVFRRLANVWAPPVRLAPTEARFILEQEARVFRELGDALRLVLREPSVLFVYCAVVLLVFLGSGILVLYVPIIQGGIKWAGVVRGTRGVGYIAAIGSIGLIISSLAYGLIGRHARRYKVMLVCFVLLGLAATGLAVFKSLAPVAPFALLAGLALAPVNIAVDTMIHESVPEHIRGRIFSSRDWVMYLSFAVFAFLVGQLTTFVAPRTLLLVIGLTTVAVSIGGFFLARGRGIR
jgi:MFS family permease